MSDGPPPAPWRGQRAVPLMVAAVAVVMLCWILGNPRSSGPDEPSHMVASAGLVRGEGDGDPNPLDPATRLFDVPAMVGAPDPVCWVQPVPNVDAPVGCANAPLTTDDRQLATTSYNYPPWALVLPGLASLIPTAEGYAYLARLLNAAVPFVFVVAALRSLLTRRPAAAAAALVGLTPIAWFTFGVVNPSAVAIAGGLALWTGLLFDRSRFGAWLAVAGWAAVLLARRDGPVWATLIVITCCWMLTLSPVEMWRSLPRSAALTALVVAPLPVLTPLVNGFHDFNLVLTLAPLALIAGELFTRSWRRSATTAGRRALVVGVVAAVTVALGVAVTNRPGGWEPGTMRLIMSNTGEHLRQLVGVLGWLSTPVPTVAVYAYWAAIGGLALVAALEYRKSSVAYLAAIAVAVVVAWLLELGQGSDYGRYWHGRYTMPFAVGLPLVLAWRPTAGGWLADRVGAVLCGTAWAISNLAFVAAQQRWAVGIHGSWNPWNWDTWDAPLPPWLLVVVHAGATAALAWVCWPPAGAQAGPEVRR